MTPLVIPLPGNEALATSFSQEVGGEVGSLETRTFPDGETYVRLQQDPNRRAVVMVCTLDWPNPKFLPLIFAAATARELGATKVGLVAPYLCYMRQDKRFHDREAITSTLFAGQLSSALDELVTVDPHLHRLRSLSEIYPIRTVVVHSAPFIAEWIKRKEMRAVLIGPDIESEQWVSEVASMAGAPYRVLRKQRLGDTDVKITIPDLHEVSDRTPVLIDDIVSSGRTMIEAARQLRSEGLMAPVCIAVHALFSPETEMALREVSSQLVTTSTVPHPTNGIDLTAAIAKAYLRLHSNEV
jgi:ribose-phosphate pyrophosphokinase